MEADYGVDSVLIKVVEHDDGRFGVAVTFYLKNGKTGDQVDSFFTGILKARFQMFHSIYYRDHLDTISNAN